MPKKFLKCFSESDIVGNGKESRTARLFGSHKTLPTLGLLVKRHSFSSALKDARTLALGIPNSILAV
jgi:hypothetical protein